MKYEIINLLNERILLEIERKKGIMREYRNRVLKMMMVVAYISTEEKRH
jgi:hypothetical protein